PVASAPEAPAPAEPAAPAAPVEAASAGAAPAAVPAPEAHADAPRPRDYQRTRAEGRPNRDRSDRADRNDRDPRGNRNGKGGSRNDRNDRSSRDNRDRNDRRPRRQRDNRVNREVVPSVTKEELAELKVAELRAKAAELGVDGTGVKKAELVGLVYDAAVKAEGFVEVTGVLDILADGYGFLRAAGYLPGEGDAYVGASTIRRNGLRKGDLVVGQTRPARENEKFAAIQKVISVNGIPLEELGARPHFKDLTPVFPDDRLLMEHGKNTITARVIDLAAPIGKGQRGLIVSPPKAGKTTVLKDIAASITANNPDVHLMYLGIDERPEEATDMERSIRGEVVSSTFDMPCENHIAVAELVIERAKRLVEMGKDVVILLDSITRLARAYNLAQPASGRILSGGVDSTALYPPKRFLGAARNIENGGSLTILASALIDTGSKMDEVIFEEFKGTGNMELKLDRYLADRRIFPAIDPVSSGTRKEELLLDGQEAPLIWAVRRILANMNNTERAMDMLIKSLKQTETNQEFLIRTAKKAQGSHGKSDEGFEF
ncbi:transcription termination factor Rho, partial [Adlercreutzia sp. ZJ242]|uniref:transcription termination factor Rho n=1 Tax=Adlercreutzia sp. ZJ242 TaxID=2709409 RepID=UPI001F153D0D